MSALGTVVQYIERIELSVPSDIVGAILLVAVTDVLFLYAPVELQFVRILLGLVAVLFVPGYLVVAVLFPHRYAAEVSPREPRTVTPSFSHHSLAFGSGPITWKGRLILSFGMSLVVIPLVGVVTAWITGALLQESILIALNVFVLCGAVVSTVQRHSIQKEKRLRLPLHELKHVVRQFFTGSSKLDTVLSFVFVVSIMVAVGTMGFALLAPSNGEQYTNVALLTEDTNGELVASGYPTELEAGESGQMVLRVENYEDAETTYTVVVELQRLAIANNTSTIVEETELLRTQETVSADETWEYPHTITPTMTGENLRLVYHVYKGPPPDDPTTDNAYRFLHLWVSVSDSDSNEVASDVAEVERTPETAPRSYGCATVVGCS